MIWTLLFGFLQKFWKPIVSVFATLIWGFRQRQAGAAKERAKREAADRLVEDIADQVQSDVGSMSPEQIDAELRKRARK